MTNHKPPCEHRWTQTTIAGHHYLKCDNCHAVSTPLAQLITTCLTNKTPEQGIADLTELLHIPRGVSVLAGSVSEERPARVSMRGSGGRTPCTHGALLQVRGVASDLASRVQGVPDGHA